MQVAPQKEAEQFKIELMFFWKLAFLAGCAAFAGLAAQPPQKILPYPYSQEDLANGLRVVTVPTDYPNIVAVYIVVQAGSRNEVEPGHTGFAHLFEHLMFKGTEKFPAAKYDETMRRIGASNNAFTTDDFTCYHATFSKEDLETVLAMEADRFQNLKYTEPEFKTETLAVLGEYNKNSSNPFRKLNEVLHDAAFDRSTYKHTTMGFLKDIQDMPNQYDYSIQFYSRYYRPEYVTILVVGDVKPKPVRDVVEKYWGAWKRGAYKAEIPGEPPQEGPRTNHVDWPIPTLPVLTVAFRAPAYSDAAKDTAALDALAFLAFSQSSPLYQRLVIEEQKVDALSGAAPSNVDPALFEITARVKKGEDVDYVRDRILETVKSFQEQPVDAARLEAVKKHLRYGVAQAMDNSESIAEILASYVALRRTPETMNALYDRYAQLTPEDVQRAASQYLVLKARTVVTLSGPAAPAQGGVQ
jgi:zinc protease